MKKIASFAIVALAAGCASMSKEECVTADWQAIGYEDGAAGRPVSAVSERRSICAKKAGVTVDMAQYMAGRDDGLSEYCRPANGYAVGSRGGVYNGVCSGPSETQFVAALETGRELYLLQSNVNSINNQIRQAQYDLRDVEHHIAATEVALVSPGHTAHERLEMLAELKQLSEEKGNIETAIIALNRDQVRAEEELADYRDEVAYYGGWRGVVEARDASY